MSEDRDLRISLPWAILVGVAMLIVGSAIGVEGMVSKVRLYRALNAPVSAEEKVRMIEVIVGPEESPR